MKIYKVGDNLFDEATNDVTVGKYINVQGVETVSADGGASHTDYISVSAKKTYKYDWSGPALIDTTIISVAWYNNAKIFIGRTDQYVAAGTTNFSLNITSPANTAYAILNFRSDTWPNANINLAFYDAAVEWRDATYKIHNTSTDTLTTLPADIYANDITATVGLKGQMEQSGTPTPTAPIQPNECGDLETTGEHTGQYKIPILCGDTTTPVYLGQVQTTRRIVKMVLDGTENWVREPNDISDRIYAYLPIANSLGYAINNFEVCSHFESSKISGANANQGIGVQNKSYPSTITAILIRWSGLTNIAGESSPNTLKQFLADQYAAGTPVTVWYVLAEPTTGIVNEPLRKIGTYADEVSGISIPTIAGANTLSVDTTLQPSEVTVNYKGWHPVADVRERENGAWT